MNDSLGRKSISVKEFLETPFDTLVGLSIKLSTCYELNKKACSCRPFY